MFKGKPSGKKLHRKTRAKQAPGSRTAGRPLFEPKPPQKRKGRGKGRRKRGVLKLGATPEKHFLTEEKGTLALNRVHADGEREPRHSERSNSGQSHSEQAHSQGQRLQKILSQAGVTSRRKAEQLIMEGRVTVNGEVVTELGSKADLERDHIKVDGQLLRAPKSFTYIALNKPNGCVTTVFDPEGRETVMHLLRGIRQRVFPVGRLDYHSEGLLLLTNDGEFAHRITSPDSHVTKTYVAKVTGKLTEDQEKIFREGVPLHGHKTAPAELRLIKQGVNPWYEVKIIEGRQNQIRIMFKYFGRLVEKLRRVKIGFLELDVAPGRYRSLTPKEIERFRKLLKLGAG